MRAELTTGTNPELKEQAEGGAVDQTPQRKVHLVVVEHHRLTLAVLVGMIAGNPAAVV